MYEKILVGTDGSERAQRAVDVALDVAEQFGAELHALYVVDTTKYAEPALSSTELATGEVESFGNQQVQSVARQGSDRDVDVVTRVCHGKVWEEIPGYADSSGIDLIVVGSRGRGGVAPPRLGRVTTRVLQSSSQPTTVV